LYPADCLLTNATCSFNFSVPGNNSAPTQAPSNLAATQTSEHLGAVYLRFQLVPPNVQFAERVDILLILPCDLHLLCALR
jgi:hypothetical protein